MRNLRIDATDERILRLLIADARATYSHIGSTVGLSANAVAQRMRRLEATGAICGYTTLLDPHLTTGRHNAVLDLSTAPGSDDAAIEAGLTNLATVTEVLDLAGSVDYRVTVRCTSPEELYTTVQRIRQLPGITSVETRPVLRRVHRK
ncbi:MAG: Lrp/AsnC family transcriptional regulator [Ornithinimicrobium sp.]